MLEARQFPCCSHYCDSKILILGGHLNHTSMLLRLISKIRDEPDMQSLSDLCCWMETRDFMQALLNQTQQPCCFYRRNRRVIVQLLSASLCQNVRSAATPNSGRSAGLVDRQETLQMKSKDNLLNDASQLAGWKSDTLGGIFSVDLRGIELGGGIFLAPSCGDDSFC